MSIFLEPIRNILCFKEKIFLFLVLSIISNQSFAYVINKSVHGDNVIWNRTTELGVYSTYANGSGISESTINTILATSIASWNQNSNIDIVNYNTADGPANRRNDLYFSSDTSLFGGGGVLAITQISYDQKTGKIIEADVIINDNVTFSSSPNSSYYIGDVISHELGHFLGLSHSQVHNSTMFYSLFKGQHTLSHDDKAGVYAMYDDSSSKGSISGNIIGGVTKVGVFGAHVQAISLKNGKVMGAVLSDDTGQFNVEGLPLDDVYYIYVEPAKALDTLPSYYSTVRKNFCSSSSNYRGSFFQSCLSSDVGHPQGIKLSTTNSKRNIGNITIKCALEVPSQYMANKGLSQNSLAVSDNFSNAGNAITGFFSQTDVSANVTDEFSLDLSQYNVSSSNQYLEIKSISQALYSEIVLDMDVTLPNASVLSYPQGKDGQGLVYDSDNKPNLDVIARIPLDSIVSSNNVFDLKITPTNFSDFILLTSYAHNDFFAASSQFSDVSSFYLLTFNISKLNSSGSYDLQSHRSYEPISDNSSCPQAFNTYQVKANKQTRTAEEVKKELKLKKVNDSPMACATVDMDDSNNNPPSQGLFSMCLGFFLAAIVARRYSSYR